MGLSSSIFTTEEVSRISASKSYFGRPRLGTSTGMVSAQSVQSYEKRKSSRFKGRTLGLEASGPVNVVILNNFMADDPAKKYLNLKEAIIAIETIEFKIDSYDVQAFDYNHSEMDSSFLSRRLILMMNLHQTSEEIILKCLKVIHKLWERNISIPNTEDFLKYSNEYSIFTESLRLYKSSPNIIITSLNSIRILSVGRNSIKLKFASDGLCELIIELIESFIHSTEVLKPLLYTGTILSTHCPEIQKRLGTLEMKKSLHFIMLMHTHYAITMECVCGLITALATNHPDNQNILGMEELKEIFVEFSKRFPRNISIRIAVCTAICALCQNHPFNQSLLCSQPMANMLVNCLTKHCDNQQLIPAVTRAIWCLCQGNRQNQQIFLATHIAPSLFPVLVSYFDKDMTVTEIICNLLYAIGYHNSEVQLQFGQVGGGRILARILESYQESNEDIISRCCDVVCAMVVGNHNNQSQIAATNIPETLLSILHNHESAADVVEKALSAVWALAASNPGCQFRFLDLGVGGVIFEWLGEGQQDTELVRVGLGALWAVTVDPMMIAPESHQMAPQRGLETYQMEQLLTSLSIHRGVAGVSLQGLWALRALCTTVHCGNHNQSLLCEYHGCELLVDLINIHQSIEEVVTVGSAAIWALTFNNEASRNIFGNCGGCELIVRLLGKGLTSTIAVENLCGVIWSMSMSHTENRNKFGALGCCELLVEVLRKHPDVVRVVELVMGAIQALCKDHHRNRGRFQACGIRDVLVTIHFDQELF